MPSLWETCTTCGVRWKISQPFCTTALTSDPMADRLFSYEEVLGWMQVVFSSTEKTVGSRSAESKAGGGAWATCLRRTYGSGDRSPSSTRTVVLRVAWDGMQFGCLVLLAHLMNIEIYYVPKLDEHTDCAFPARVPSLVGGGQYWRVRSGLAAQALVLAHGEIPRLLC